MRHLKYYAFYGSLRRGMGNYGPHANHLLYIDTARLDGFRMFSLGEYPFAVIADPGHTIVVELFEVMDPDTEQMICAMELDAGYILSSVHIEKTLFGIFLFENAATTDRPVVHGDWCRYWQEGAF